jgi:hypothetical protein
MCEFLKNIHKPWLDKSQLYRVSLSGSFSFLLRTSDRVYSKIRFEKQAHFRKSKGIDKET